MSNQGRVLVEVCERRRPVVFSSVDDLVQDRLIFEIRKVFSDVIYDEGRLLPSVPRQRRMVRSIRRLSPWTNSIEQKYLACCIQGEEGMLVCGGAILVACSCMCVYVYCIM